MKKIILLILFSTIFFVSNVYAENNYVNENGVIFTEKEYKMISDFYWDGYQDHMTMKDYNFLLANNFFENEIQIHQVNYYVNYYNNGLMPLNEHTTASKTLKISKNCSTNCIISISLIWLKIPKIRSYDILGAYLSDTSLLSANQVYVETDKDRINYSIDKNVSHGIGTSFKLPNELNSLKINQTITVEKKGVVKASYQHAKKSISYENSRKYSFSENGIGGVFNFEYGIQDYYDCMLGVEIALS